MVNEVAEFKMYENVRHGNTAGGVRIRSQSYGMKLNIPMSRFS